MRRHPPPERGSSQENVRDSGILGPGLGGGIGGGTGGGTGGGGIGTSGGGGVGGGGGGGIGGGGGVGGGLGVAGNTASTMISAPPVLNAEALFESLKNQPVHRSEMIREAAEVFLLSMLNMYSNFPTLAGSAQVTSKELEEMLGPSNKIVSTLNTDEDNTLYFIYNSLSLFALRQFEDNGST
jgi:hypothetical protein